MVLNELDKISQLYNIQLMSHADKRRITVNGSLENVRQGTSHIQQMARTISHDTQGVSDREIFVDGSDCNLYDFVTDLEKLKLRENNNTEKLSCHTDLSAFSSGDSNCDVLETDSCCEQINITTYNEKLYGSQSGRSSPETETEKILSDPDHSNHIEKALKLGYSESQIAVVLKKLGATATTFEPNTFLSELIQLGTVHTPDLETVQTSDEAVTSKEDEQEITPENANDPSNLRPIVIDGSNVAMSHGNKEVFSCRGIQLAVDYFKQRGHKITVFVPQWRKEMSRPDAQIIDQDIITQLEKEKILVFTPSRRIGGRRVVCYDDRFILDLAADQNGIVVSNDNYRDLHKEKSQYKQVAEEQLLQYVFVDDRFMPPLDPLGKHGPTLDNFLRIKPLVSEPLQPCPYGKKCTYGNKCRFSHPERGNRPQKSVTDMLSEQSSQKLKDRAIKLEEKKKKEVSKKKQALRRTQSLFPVESCSKEFRPLTKSESIDESKIDKRIKHDINEKLNEYRLKYELQRKSRDVSPVGIVLNEYHSSKDIEFDSGSDPSENLFQECAAVEQKSGPENTKEGFISGHLSLAKKLSDEAQDKRFFDSERKFLLNQQSERDQGMEVRLHSKLDNSEQYKTRLSVDMQEHSTPFPVKLPSHHPAYHSPVARGPQGSVPRAPLSNVDYEIYYSDPSTFMRQNSGAFTRAGDHIPSYPFTDIDVQYRNHARGSWDAGMGLHRAFDPVYPPVHRQSYPGNIPHRQSYYSEPQMYRGLSPDHGYNQSAYNVPLPDPNSHQPIDSAVYYQRQQNEVHYGRIPGYMQSQNSPFYTDVRSSPWQIPHTPLSNPHQPVTIRGQSPAAATSVSAQQQFNTKIQPTDRRYALFYNLCSLFPEHKVTAVMNMYPTEEDPEVLCTYIIGLN